MRSIRAGAAALSLVLSLASGARAAEPTPEQIEAEAQRLGGVILEHMFETNARVVRVGDTIRIAGAPNCGKQIGAVLGIWAANEDTLSKDVGRDLQYREWLLAAARKRFQLDGRERILLVVPDLPGAKAGLRAGDIVTGVSGRKLSRRDRIHALKVDEGESLSLSIEREGQELVVPLETKLGCAYPAQAWFGNDINAFAGHMGKNTGSYVLGGMLEFLPSDDDLGIVLGHELAHLILYSGGTRRTEADADYLGLYLAARAGYDVARAPAVEERLGRANPYWNIQWGFYSHPSSPQRTEALRVTIAEIAAKRAAEQPLTPNPQNSDAVTVDEKAEAEATAQIRASALEELQAKRERLLRVSHKLRTGGAELCGDKVAPVLGAALARRRDALFGKESEAAEIFGLVDEVKVLAVLPDAPAAAAGVTKDDLVLKANGEGISRTEAVFKALRDHPEQAPVLTLSRGGAESEVTLPRVVGCREEFKLVVRGSFDPWADRNGDDLMVPEGLLRFSRDDDELAIVLAHQIAHHQLGSSLLTNFSDETGADELGLRIAQRAGFDVSKAPALLDRMVAEQPWKLETEPDERYRTLHGDAARRSLAVRAEVAKLLRE